jgi:hypothetical protein
MSRTVLRRTASAAVLTLALSAFAACGGDDESADDPAPETTSSTSDEPTDESSDEPTDESSDAAPTAGEEIDASEMIDVFAGAFEQATTATFAMTTGTDAASVEATGEADFSTVPPAMHVSMTIAQMPQPIEMIIVDGTLYQSGLDGSGKFTASSLDDPSSPFAGLGDQLDIRSQFDAMEKAVTAATYVGEEDGFEHYSLVLDSKVLLENQGTDTSTLPQGTLPPSFTYDLYFDEDGYFRKMESDLGDAGGTLVATYDNWGEPVDISAPPASQIQ